MNTYISGTDILVTIPLSVDGIDVSAESVSYRVVNGDDVEIIAKTVVSAFVVGDIEVVLTIPAISNTIAGTATREIRMVEIYINDGSGEFKIEQIYGIEKDAVLVEGVNSFQGYGKSLMTAMTIVKIDGWDEAEKKARVNALIEARLSMASVPLRHTFQDYGLTHVEPNFAFRDITRLTQIEFASLPQDLKTALCRAQILQANYLLTSHDGDVARDAGITSTTIGEAKQVYSTAIKYRGAVDKRAMQELSRWIVSGIRTSR